MKRGKKEGKSGGSNKRARASAGVVPILISKSKVNFSPSILHRSAHLKLSDDMLSVIGDKGFCMARASHGVRHGKYYFEMTVEPSPNANSHCRLGWCTSRGDLEAPVGYDQHSYGYRDVDGSKVHQSIRTPMGDPYGPGDVLGFSIDLPVGSSKEAVVDSQETAAPVVQPEPVAGARGAGALTRNVQTYNLQTVPNTEIRFFKNGVEQGVAFTDIYDGTYFPAASLYMGAVVRFNPGPNFSFPPSDASFKPFSSMLTANNSAGEEDNESKGETESYASPLIKSESEETKV